jgi:hypothetical protein
MREPLWSSFLLHDDETASDVRHLQTAASCSPRGEVDAHRCFVLRNVDAVTETCKVFIIRDLCGCVAQWLVHLHDNLEVLGSIPGGG